MFKYGADVMIHLNISKRTGSTEEPLEVACCCGVGMCSFGPITLIRDGLMKPGERPSPSSLITFSNDLL